MDLKDRLSAALAGRYEILEEIGRGGMAVVYLARDLKLERRVAIKVLRPEFSASLVADRFVQEIQIAARLEHPLIVSLHESDSSNGLLWYAMPYVRGESLQRRLTRENQLPVDEAVAITCEVAEALSYAHGQGVIHRDIKPANILLSEGHPRIADFGIAKAFTDAGGPLRTGTAVGIGTVGYMSPEQATGEQNIDPRTDIYSLGCVLFEMLAGETPYTGPSAQAIIAKQLSLTVPSVCTVRDTVPPALDGVLRRALAKVPADRFATVSGFADAARSAADPSAPSSGPVRLPSFRERRRVFGPAAFATSAAAAAMIGWLAMDGTLYRPDREMPADTSRYAILPFEYEPNLNLALNEIELLHDALSRWSGISVADPFQVREALAQLDAGPLTHRRASRVAVSVGAGRYLRGSVSRVGDSVRVEAGLYALAPAQGPLATHTVRIPLDLASADSMFSVTADHLLFRGSLPGDTPALSGTRSLPARQAFARGQRAFETWELSQADSAFAEATRLDADYAQAHIWLALSRVWSQAPPARWRIPAEQAALRRERLSERDRLMADAALAQLSGDFGGACQVWQRLTEQHARDFVAWYGWAFCQANDSIVVPDSRSPSGWRFRSSYHRALVAYRRAFELLPSILESFRGRSHESLRRLLFTGGNARRFGRAASSDTTWFAADLAWEGDTLALVPRPRQQGRQLSMVLPATREEAIRHQRQFFRDIAVSWAAAFPGSAHALEAVGLALAMLGDPSAVDTLHRARSLVVTPRERLNVGGTQIWTRLAFALPARTGDIAGARELADSLLRDYPPNSESDPLLLAGLSALTGRAMLAAAYMRHPLVNEALGVPAPLHGIAPALLIYSALGGPHDSLVALEARVRNVIDRSVPPDHRDAERSEWLGRAVGLAFPTLRFEALTSLTQRGAYLLDLQSALVGGDSASVRSGLSRIRQMRQPFDPAYLTLDVLYPEAELLTSMGDLRGAAEWLDPTLGGLSRVTPGVLGSPERAAALVRAMALRATIADQLGDASGAQLWATAVTTLWSDADPFLQPVVQQALRLRKGANANGRRQ